VLHDNADCHEAREPFEMVAMRTLKHPSLLARCDLFPKTKEPLQCKWISSMDVMQIGQSLVNANRKDLKAKASVLKHGLGDDMVAG
jgi:hypothetical protein